MENLKGEIYFTYKEVATLLKCSNHYIYDLVTSKKLIASKIQARNIKHVSLENFLKYLETTNLEENAKRAIEVKAIALASKPDNVNEDELKQANDFIDNMANSAENIKNLNPNDLTVNSIVNAIIQDYPISNELRAILTKRTEELLGPLINVINPKNNT